MIEIHQPPTSRSSMACPKTRMARMGAKDYQWNATPSGPRHERRADLPFGVYDLIDLLSGESHVGDQLLCPDCAAPGLQARYSSGLNFTRSRHQRTARGLA